MNYTVKYVSHINQFGEYMRELVIEHNGIELARYSDGGEPEDNTFSRDWYWIKSQLETAYRLGVIDGEQGRA